MKSKFPLLKHAIKKRKKNYEYEYLMHKYMYEEYHNHQTATVVIDALKY